ncbi:MAG: DUF4126 domain-containing protein [Thiogranum sp.]
MDSLEQVGSVIALSMGMAWASGINLYAALLTLGVLAHTGNLVLPEPLQVVANPLVIGAAAVMYVVEFFADKVPGVDTGWDVVQSFVRIPGGAILAAAAVGDLSPAAELAAGILGGGLAATTHATKAGMRVMINTSPEPVSNWSASITEDVAVIGGVWAALNHPYVFLGLLAVFVLLMAWLLPRIWRGIKAVVSKLTSLFGKPAKPPALPEPSAGKHREPSDQP